jgi:hypothetical protein
MSKLGFLQSSDTIEKQRFGDDGAKGKSPDLLRRDGDRNY